MQTSAPAPAPATAPGEHTPEPSLAITHALSRHVPAMAQGFEIHTKYGAYPIEPGPLADEMARLLKDYLQSSALGRSLTWHNDDEAQALGGYSLTTAPVGQPLHVQINGKLLLVPESITMPPQQASANRLRQWHGDDTAKGCFARAFARDGVVVVGVADVKDGQRVIIREARAPYADYPKRFFTLAPDKAFSESNNAKTSELEGLASKLSAMLRAVRSRSYTTMAVSASVSCPALCSMASLLSNASVPSIVVSPGDKEPDATELAALATLISACLAAQGRAKGGAA